MAPFKKIFFIDIIFMISISLGVIVLIYISTYFAFRDFSIFKSPPCGKNKKLLARFKYFDNYDSSYVASLEVTKFSYFVKKKISLFAIYKPLEKIELLYYDFEYHSLSKLQIAEIKKNSDWYRNEFKIMDLYDKFDESKLKE